MTNREFANAYVDPNRLDLKSAKEGLYYAANALNQLPVKMQCEATRLMIIAQNAIENSCGENWQQHEAWAIASVSAIAYGVCRAIAKDLINPNDTIQRQSEEALFNVAAIGVNAEDIIADMIKKHCPKIGEETNCKPKRDIPNMN